MGMRTIRHLTGAVFLVAILAAAPLTAIAQQFTSAQHIFRADILADGLNRPWGLVFMPDGRFLITERSGRMRLVTGNGAVSAPLDGVPEVVARGQGGLLDVVLHPDHAANGWLYLSFSAPQDGGAVTGVVRARLDGDKLADTQTIFMGNNLDSGGRHFGSRLVFGRDGMLYVTLGERGDSDKAQALANHNGTIVRLHDDGRVPDDNPFLGQAGARPEIYTYGHRNPQGMARHPVTGDIWTHEHGPRGGDEINILRAGTNYGWPVITYGESYAGFAIGEGTSAPGMAQPLHYWTPSIAPSGMAFYRGDAFPGWRGSLFVGSLKFRYLARLTLDGNRVVGEERLLEGAFGRIRDVRVGPDGFVYVLTDESDGQLIRLEPAGD